MSERLIRSVSRRDLLSYGGMLTVATLTTGTLGGSNRKSADTRIGQLIAGTHSPIIPNALTNPGSETKQSQPEIYQPAIYLDHLIYTLDGGYSLHCPGLELNLAALDLMFKENPWLRVSLKNGNNLIDSLAFDTPNAIAGLFDCPINQPVNLAPNPIIPIVMCAETYDQLLKQYGYAIGYSVLCYYKEHRFDKNTSEISIEVTAGTGLSTLEYGNGGRVVAKSSADCHTSKNYLESIYDTIAAIHRLNSAQLPDQFAQPESPEQPEQLIPPVNPEPWRDIPGIQNI